MNREEKSIWQRDRELDRDRRKKMSELMDEYDKTVYYPSKLALQKECEQSERGHHSGKYHDNGYDGVGFIVTHVEQDMTLHNTPNMIPDIRPMVWKIALEVAKESEKYCANPVNPESEQFQFIVHELSESLLASVMAEVVDEVQYLVDWEAADAVQQRVNEYLESK